MSYLTLSSKEKHPFFTLFILSRASDITTSLNIGGTNACMGRPPPQILGGTVPPVSPRSPPLLSYCYTIILVFNNTIQLNDRLEGQFEIIKHMNMPRPNECI